MTNAYRKLMETVFVPEGLNERVLLSAREAERAGNQPKRLARPRRVRPILRTAVCGACALALVLGSLSLPRPASVPDDGGAPVQDGGTVPAPILSFGLTACAAQAETPYVPGPNGGIAFQAGEGMANPGEGSFTGCLFQITGQNIETVSLSIDRGGLYRYVLHENLTDAEIDGFRQAMAEGRMATAAISQTDDGMWYMPEMTALGQTVREDYDPAVRYGFWLSPEEMSYNTGMDMTAETEADIDRFDGAELTVSAAFTDGAEQTRTYRLSSGRLRIEKQITGGLTLLPQLAGDDEAYVYGLYAEDQASGRYFRWPVEGSNQVSMSYPFGSREKTFVNVNENGEEEPVTTTLVHNGIDIPAPAGTPILAAADGTVTESGYDPKEGNYVVLDHGNGLRSKYAACQEITVSEGAAVTAGQEIALAGSTGLSTGPHLCFQVWQDGEAQNPVAYFDSAVRDTLEAA